MPEASLRTALTLSVVSHGHGEMLQRVLHDLASCPALRGAHVVVTLNLAHEPFDPAPFAALDVTVRRNRAPRGFGANHNAAFVECRTPWFAILNPDLRVHDPTVFSILLCAAKALPSAALLAPVVLDPTGREEDSVRFNLSLPSLLSRHLRGGREAPPDTSQPAVPGAPFYWLAGMFLLARADVFRAIGGFDERYFLYCEDYDLSARVFDAGHALLRVRAAQVVHDAQRDSHRSLRHLKMHVASLLKVWCSPVFWRVRQHERGLSTTPPVARKRTVRNDPSTTP